MRPTPNKPSLIFEAWSHGPQRSTQQDSVHPDPAPSPGIIEMEHCMLEKSGP
jgi:hypothetical protein